MTPDGSCADGRAALADVAPAPSAALQAVEAAMWREAATGDLTQIVGWAAQVCAGQLGLEPLPVPAGVPGLPPGGDWRSLPELSEATAAALGFAEQFSCDVSAITDAARAALFDAVGRGAGTFAQAVYVVDVLPRVRAALDAMFGRSAWPAPDAAAGGEGLWAAMGDVIRTVPRLAALDPVTSELVRLRGARQHQCRLCQSLRSRPALLAGATDLVFDAVDVHRSTSHLTPAQQAALALTDAMIWTPGRIEPETLTALAAHFTPEQRVELVLDVARNAMNKVAVSLKADAPHVDDGYEIYDIGPDGELVYGLTLA